MQAPAAAPGFDVAIIGGAFSGAATALLLKRRQPGLRIAIVERAAEFDRKVGESTTEVSSCFLTRVLGLSTYLGHEQLAKQGLRMWFTKSAGQGFEECVEMGARYQSRLPGFQVDRARLDEHVLDLARQAGCELFRPARVTELALEGAGQNRLTIKTGQETATLHARWVVDASGRAAVIARKLELLRQNTAHPVNAIWGRFTGVKDWDGHEMRQKFPCYAKASRTSRAWATNHLMGLGWWCWIIPLKGGDYSIGLVYDERLFTPPAGESIAARIKAHVATHPVGREMLAGIELVQADQKAYAALPYCSEQVAGNGWTLVGDASAFLDPLYSPGLDFCAFTAQGAVSLIERALAGEEMAPAIAKYNERFRFCYEAWFDTIYRDKYYYMGDAELMGAAFLLDIATYHLGPVRQVYADPETQFAFFPFDGIPGRVARGVMSFYNRRLAALAKKRIANGTYGAANAGWRLMVGGFVPDASVLKLVRQGVWRWLKAEIRTALSKGPRRPVAAASTGPETAAAAGVP